MIFNQDIYITGTRANGRRTIASSLAACMVDDGVSSDSVDGQLVASVDRFTFFVRTADWPDSTPPQIGDSIRIMASDQRFLVTRVARLGDCYSLNSRSR